MASSSVEPRLEALLEKCANGTSGITFYSTEDVPPTYLSYRELRDEASFRASCLRRYPGMVPGRIVLVHFHTHHENIIWFWASILAGCVPAMSTPFVNNREGRASHLAHLQSLLLVPLVITSRELMDSDFSENSILQCVAVEAIESLELEKELSSASSNSPKDDMEVNVQAATGSSHEGMRSTHLFPSSVPRHIDQGAHSSNSSQYEPIHDTDNSCGADSSASSVSDSPHTARSLKPGEEIQTALEEYCSLEGVAALMLTSGSTGAAKAVSLRHDQIMTACYGKLSHMPLSDGDVVLNWIGLDHVGSLVELHLTSMVADCDQIHVPTTEIIADPLLFFRLLSKHGAVRTFAPNFMLAKLQQVLDVAPASDTQGLDLRKLRYLISGGEPNSVDTCIRMSKHLQNLGATTENIITPGFGMTETCAGAIYSRNCPAVDAQAGTEFAALGTCVPGIEMRVHEGSLELSGPIVFHHYFNNADATREAFTEDGWFRTGDTATIDANNTLRLIGRSKDLIIVNGVKYLPQELEAAIEQARIAGVALSSVVCFAYRPEGAVTESIQVVYQRDFDTYDRRARMEVLQAIIRTVVSLAGARPRVLPLAPGRLERSTLGKLSRAKVRTSLLKGEYQDEADIDNLALQEYRQEHSAEPGNTTERTLMKIFHDLELGAPEMGIDTPILDTGVTSVDLIRLKRAAETEFQIKEIPIIVVMTNTTIRTLASAILSLQTSQQQIEYNPIVTLQPNGDKTPLFLLHPGIGEMLVFLGLVQYFPDRPIYAFRARGLNEGEEKFASLQEVVTTYHAALKAKQPHGPYALAGYSYGSMLAFEIAKVLEASGDEVGFLGSFNLPPHIKTRMRRLDWTAGMVHIAHFCSIISEERSEELMQELRPLPHEEQVSLLLAESDGKRCAELALTHAGLQNWTDVSWSLQRIGWEYEPCGDVSHMDVFYCEPLKDVARGRVEYRKEHLNHWVGFIRDDLKFWEVGGKHYTMIGTEHVGSFQGTLKKALAARGL